MSTPQQVDLNIEMVTSRQIKEDFERLQLLMLHDVHDVDVFFETAPFDTGEEILTMPTVDEGGLDNQSVDDDLRTSRCHVESRVRDVVGLVKGHDPEDPRLYIVSENHGILAMVKPTLDQVAPSTYHIVGSEALLSYLGDTIDPLQ